MMPQRQVIRCTPEEYQRFSSIFENVFSSEDLESIAKEVLKQGVGNKDCYRSTCLKYPKLGFKFNFHPEKHGWLGTNKENTVIKILKDAVKAEYRQLNFVFKNAFTDEDVQSITKIVHQLGTQGNRYRIACDKYRKPGCPLKFNFHPSHSVWLGVPSENCIIRKLKRFVRGLKTNKSFVDQVDSLTVQNAVYRQALKKHKNTLTSSKRKICTLSRRHDEATQVIVSTYAHLCDDTHTLTPHITLVSQGLCQGDQGLGERNSYLAQGMYVTKKDHERHD